MSVPRADVCLLLEGTYPYVLGGVSAWVDQIIKGLPDLTFNIFFIGSQKQQCTKQVFQLPPNVVGVTEVFLHDKLPPDELAPAQTSPELRERIYKALGEFYLAENIKARAEKFWPMLQLLTEAGPQFTFGNLMQDEEAWELLKQIYMRFAPNESFIDFFWTARFLHLPLWTLLRSLSKVPEATVYHTVSAGYAGLVSAIIAKQRNSRCVITEHGIYTKERIAEISQAEWIYEGDFELTGGALGKLKEMWIALFMLQGQIVYDTAERIITLYEGNAVTQIEFGADPRKIEVIPNGIAPQKFNDIYKVITDRWNPEPPLKTVGFVGRVVPIKDVKTLLRAARLVIEQTEGVQFLIAGPYAEDPGYFEECQKIVKLLNIEEQVKFLGMSKLMEVLPRMDVMVLTSISEGLPLVVLEAMAAGIPNVATDVGACRELIFGRVAEDKALGRAGVLTKILSPQETANGLIAILKNPDLWRKYREAGRARAEQFYSMDKLIEAYRNIYTNPPVSKEPRKRVAKQPAVLEGT